MRNVHRQALENLERHNLSTTLVCVVRKGVNDDEIGDIIDYAQQWRCVRGVTFQPVQDAGRNDGAVPAQRMTLSEIRSRVIAAPNPFGEADIIPLPCHPENIAIGYAMRIDGTILPVTGLLPREELLKGVDNTISFEKNTALRDAFYRLFSLDACAETSVDNLQTMLCCLPRIENRGLTYENVFRIVIMKFMDRYDFDLGSVKRSCTHFVEPDGRIYPFDTWNLFYRARR